jgi:hypothetical protein
MLDSSYLTPFFYTTNDNDNEDENRDDHYKAE